MKYKKVEYKQFLSVNRRFGVELEMSDSINKRQIKDAILEICNDRVLIDRGWSQSKGNNYWHIKYDATCGPIGKGWDRGWEVASPIGSSYSDIIHFSKIASQLKLYGAEVNNNCGLHVHLEALDLSKSQVATLMGWWMKLENMVKMSISLTRDYSYCRPMQRVYTLDKNHACSPELMWEMVKPLSYSIHDNPYRWRSINLVNYIKKKTNKRCTLEFRMPEGTLESNSVKCWILFFLIFVDRCKNLSMPSNFRGLSLPSALEILGLNHSNGTFYIFDETLFDLKYWLLTRIYYNTMISGHEKINKDATKMLNEMCNPLLNFA